jgi:hypothetical protein
MRVTKREFVKAASAVALVMSARRSALTPGAAALPAQVPGKEPTPASDSFDVIVYNNWFPQAHDFASRFPGARTLPVGGDAGQLWYGTLRGLIHRGFRRIAGLTSHTDLLILETLARETGLKVRSRVESGRLVSWVLT